MSVLSTSKRKTILFEFDIALQCVDRLSPKGGCAKSPRAATALDLSKAAGRIVQHSKQSGRNSAMGHFRPFSGDVRFIPESGHSAHTRRWPLCVLATKVQCNKSDLFDLLVDGGK